MKLQLSFSLFLTVVFCVSAQKPETRSDLIFSHLDTHNGLSFNDARCIIKDSKGYVWIGTQDGLSKYNGQEFKIYKHNFRNNNSLVDNRVFSLAEDKDGKIWVGTASGVSMLDPGIDSFVNFTHNDTISGSLANNFKIILYCDQDNNIWCGTHEGLDKLDRKTKTFIHYHIPLSDPREDIKKVNTIKCIYQDSRKRLWIGTIDGLFLLDQAKGEFSRFGSTHSNPDWPLDNLIECIYEDHQHQLWVGTWGGGLKKFLPEKGRFESFYYGQDPNNRSTTNIVLSIAEAKNIHGGYDLWLSTIQGAARFDDKSKTFIFYPNDKLNLSSPSLHPSYIYCDNTNLLWFACTEGIDVLDEKAQFFTTHYFTEKYEGTFQQQFGQVKTMDVKQNHIWAGCWYGNGAYRLDRDLNIQKIFHTVPPGNADREGAQISDIYEEKDGSTWFCSFGGLAHYDVGRNSWKLFTADTIHKGGMPSNKVTRFWRDSKGTAWICFYHNGVYWLNEQTGTFTCAYTHSPKIGVNDLIEDEDHNVWLATEYGSLLKYDPLRDSFTTYAAPQYVPDASINSLMIDKHKNLWCSTIRGLSIIDLKNFQVKFLTNAEGLSNDNVSGTLEDSLGRVWIATMHGLDLYDAKRNTIRALYKEDGLPEDALSAAFTKGPDRRFFLTGYNYITEFYPDRMPVNEFVPPVRIISAKVFGAKVPLRENEKHEKSLHLNWQQKQISFEFDVLNFRNPSKNKFYCKLDGFDKDWREVKSGIANYTNLDAGDYVFHVRGANNDGVLNETGDLVMLSISPPFWKTGWFFFLSIAVVSGSLYALYRYRLDQMLKLERMRTRIATDLHDDIGATLSSISMMTHIAEQSDKKTEKEFLRNIGENSRALIDRMDDIVWSLKPNNDSLQKTFARLCQYAAPLMNARNILFEAKMADELISKKVEMNQRQNIYLIAKEAINNLLKYSECTEAKLEMLNDNGDLVMSIWDNGKGIQENKLREGNGLLNMKQRAKEMNGVLRIESLAAKGTLVELRIKIG